MSHTVLYFATKMQEVFDDNMLAGKRGWYRLTPKECLKRLRQETKELTRAIEQNKNKEEVASECADVANFAMFIYHNYEQATEQAISDAEK